MLYIVGTEIDTKVKNTPSVSLVNKNLSSTRQIRWLPPGHVWELGTIRPTKDADTVDYHFYSKTKHERYVVTFKDCSSADQAIAAARGDKIVDDESGKNVDYDEKMSYLQDKGKHI